MPPRNYFQITIHHPGLNKERVIRGNDRNLLEAAAATQHRAWSEQYARKFAVLERQLERQLKRRELTDSLSEADLRTDEAQAALGAVRGLLQATLGVDDRVDWAALKQPPFSQEKPGERPFLPLTAEPVFDLNGWKAQRNFVANLLPFVAKRAEAAARGEFVAVHSKWRERNAAVQATNERIYLENLRQFEDWNRRKEAYEESRIRHNTSIDEAKAAYFARRPDAISEYCDLVLAQSCYPDCFPKQFELHYRENRKTVIVHYALPAPDDLPRLQSVKFSKTKGDFVEGELTKRDFEQLYADVVFQVALRSVHELFEADVIGALDQIVFNGVVRVVNAGNGHEEERCILSLCAGRTLFVAINLENVEPCACFEALGGIAGQKMIECRAVTPHEAIDRADDRFASAQDVSAEGAGGLDEWNGLVESISGPDDIRFLPLGTVATLLGFPLLDKYPAAMSRDIAEAASLRKYALEPDARSGGGSYKQADEIALFRPLELTVTSAYPGAVVLLQLGVMIAAADEHPTETELKIARDFIHANVTLTNGELVRLAVLEKYLCRNPDGAQRSLSRLAKKLSVPQRTRVGEVLVCVAAADGVITPGEWRALERACTILELPQSTLGEILRTLGASFEEPTVQEAVPSGCGEELPDTRSAVPAFELDMSRVAAISQETSEVIGLLSAVMSEEDSPPTRFEPSRLEEMRPADWLCGLEPKYQKIAERVIERSVWTKSEFQELAAEYNLMPLGAVDALNEWSDDHLGDFLLNGDDPVQVNESILPEKS